MPHPQTIPSRSLYWEHTRFQGRRIGAPGDGNLRRSWGVIYGGFASADAAAAYPDVEPEIEGVLLQVRGNLVDTFFYDETANAYTQTEAQVGACLYWMLTQNPTAAELASTEGLERARRLMAGASMFGGAFTVTELPAERAEEE